MTKLIDQYAEINNARQKAAESAVATRLGNIPSVIFTPGDHGNDFAPKEWEVISVSAKFIPGTWVDPGKRPTRDIIQKLRDAEEVDADSVFIHVRRAHSSRGFSISSMGLEWALAKEPMDAKGQELRDFYTLKPGQFHCRQCGKATDNSQMVTRRIIARQYPGGGKDFDHCSTLCASHNQMAHEG